MDFTCCYCEQKFGTFEETIEHSVLCHPCEQLKYRNVILNVESGKKQYVTKSFNVIPSKVHENEQIISVQGEHRIRTEQKHDSWVNISQQDYLQIRSKKVTRVEQTLCLQAPHKKDQKVYLGPMSCLN